jgi:PAS domain S-box-containing protein
MKPPETAPLKLKTSRQARRSLVPSDTTADRELRDWEERFYKLFNVIPVAITISSLQDGRFIAVNEHYLKILGVSRENVIGRTSFEIGVRMRPDLVDRLQSQLRQDGAVADFEAEVITRTGETKTGLLSAVVLDIQGEPFAAVAFTDITERKKAEHALQLLATRLLTLQDSERRRIARELHDTAAQKISAVLLHLSYVKKVLAQTSGPVSEALDEAISIAEDSLREIRTMSYVLHPPLLDQSGLRSALRWLVNGFTKRSGIDVHLEFLGPQERLPTVMESAIFRIVQEALTNIHRHSGASRASIRVERTKDEVVAEIRDQGVGIWQDTQQVQAVAADQMDEMGLGIMGMRELLCQLKGDLSIQSSSSGTAIIARIPHHGK